jgi:hypothetical protein
MALQIIIFVVVLSGDVLLLYGFPKSAGLCEFVFHAPLRIEGNREGYK